MSGYIILSVVENTFGSSSGLSDTSFCLQWLLSICFLSSAFKLLILSSRSTIYSSFKTKDFYFEAWMFTVFLQVNIILDSLPRTFKIISLYLSRLMIFSYSKPKTPMTSSRMNSCLQFGCPYCLISETSWTGTISNSLSVCSRSARWRAVAFLPVPGPPIMVVIDCDWTLSRIFGKLWISWNNLSSFFQYSNCVLCDSKNTKMIQTQIFYTGKMHKTCR